MRSPRRVTTPDAFVGRHPGPLGPARERLWLVVLAGRTGVTVVLVAVAVSRLAHLGRRLRDRRRGGGLDRRRGGGRGWPGIRAVSRRRARCEGEPRTSV